MFLNDFFTVRARTLVNAMGLNGEKGDVTVEFLKEPPVQIKWRFYFFFLN